MFMNRYTAAAASLPPASLVTTALRLTPPPKDSAAELLASFSPDKFFTKVVKDRRPGDVELALYLRRLTAETPSLRKLFLPVDTVQELPDGGLLMVYPRLSFPRPYLPEGKDTHNVEADAHTLLMCPHLPDELLVKFLEWLLWSVGELHQRGFYLRDLKLENIGCFQDAEDGTVGFCHIDTESWWVVGEVHGERLAATNEARSRCSEMYVPYYVHTLRDDRVAMEVMDWYACTISSLTVSTYLFNKWYQETSYASDLLPLCRALRADIGPRQSFHHVLGRFNILPDQLTQGNELFEAIHRPSQQSVFRFAQTFLNLYQQGGGEEPWVQQGGDEEPRVPPPPPSKRQTSGWKRERVPRCSHVYRTLFF